MSQVSILWYFPLNISAISPHFPSYRSLRRPKDLIFPLCSLYDYKSIIHISDILASFYSARLKWCMTFTVWLTPLAPSLSYLSQHINKEHSL
jgi:hypothetical protein